MKRAKESRPSGRSGSKRKRLSLQQLESRRMMAADIALVDTTLSIQGSSMNDVAEVYVDSDKLIVKVSTFDEAGQIVNARSEDYSADDVRRIVFEGHDGDDLWVNDSLIPSVARGGEGNDTLMGGGGDDVLVGGVGDDLILSGGGNCDIVLAGPGENVVVGPSGNGAPEVSSTDQVDETSVPTSNEGENDVEPEATSTDQVDETSVPTSNDDAGEEQETADESSAESEQNSEIVDDQSQDPAGEDDADSMPCELQQQEETPTVNVELISDDVQSDVAPIVAAETQGVSEVGQAISASDSDPETEPTATETEMNASQTITPIDAIDVPQMPANDPVGLDIEDITTAADDPVEDSDADDAPVNGEVEETAEQAESTVDEPETDNDVIFGGKGDDWLFGENGNDMIFGDSSPLDDALMRGVISGRFRI